MIAYKITNVITGMVYIGITSKSVEARWRAHQQWAKCNKPYALHMAIRNFGALNFNIEHIASAKTHSDLLELEKQLIAQYDSLYPKGYNKTVGGQGSLGYKHTAETRKKISEKVKASGPRAIPREAIERARIARIGQKRTAEQKKCISSGRVGKGLLNDAARKIPKEVVKKALDLITLGVKQKDIVKITGLSQSYVSNLKTGKRGTTLKGV